MADFPIIIFSERGFYLDPAYGMKETHLIFVEDPMELPSGVPFSIVLKRATREDFDLIETTHRRMR